MFHTEAGALFLVFVSIATVMASVVIVIINVTFPLSLRFNLVWLAAMCAFCALSMASFYDWI